jgi:maltoporin
MNIPAGPGVVDVAWICHTSNNKGDYPIIADKGQNVQQNLDIRYKGIKALGGEFELELTPSKSTGKVSDAKNAESGIQGAVVYSRADFFGLTGGSSKVGFQAGKGLGANVGGCNGTYMNEDALSMQLIAWGVSNITDKLKVSPSFAFRNISKREGENHGNGKDDFSWFGITVRPQYNFTRNLALQAEVGYEKGHVWAPVESWTSGKGLEEADIFKLTIAPTITLDDTSFWTRPQLRAFATYATFDKNATNAGINDISMAGKDNGMVYGVQMEAWW